MLTEGYAAVSTRQVAKKIGLTPALVHYYFPTTDDLLVAAYRRAVERTVADLQKRLASAHPLRALWSFGLDANCTALALEFMAMANHRKSIRAELASSSEAVRTMQAKALAQLPAGKRSPQMNAFGITVLMAGVSRLLVLEKTLGISVGHKQARAMVEDWIESNAPDSGARSARAKRAAGATRKAKPKSR